MDLISQAQASKKRLEGTLSSAFAFLVNDYNYKEEPVTYGPSHLRAFTKIFRIGTRCIEFSGDYDRMDFYDLCFHPFNLWARSELHRSIRFTHSWNMSIGTTLDYLGIDVSLPRTGKIDDVAPRFAAILGKYATDLIEGDFTVFPPVVLVVEHVKVSGGEWSRQSLGTFSTIEEVEHRALNIEASFNSSSKEYIEIIGRTQEPECIK